MLKSNLSELLSEVLTEEEKNEVIQNAEKAYNRETQQYRKRMAFDKVASISLWIETKNYSETTSNAEVYFLQKIFLLQFGNIRILI